MKHHRSVIKVVHLTTYNTYFVKIELRPISGLLDYDLSCVRWVWLDYGQIQNQSKKKNAEVIFLNFSVGIVSLLCEFNCYSLIIFYDILKKTKKIQKLHVNPKLFTTGSF